jgi:hypothetical protein
MTIRKTTLGQWPLALAALAAIWGGLALWPCPAAACPMTSTSLTGITIRVSDGQDAGEMTWLLQPSQTDGDRYGWSLSEPVAITSGGRVLATVTSLIVSIDVDPGVELKFEVTAPPSAKRFTITSVVVPFSAIINPLAYATAAVTVTDNDGDGATLTGLYPGIKAYRASYNAAPVDWAYLVDPVVVDPDCSNVGMQRQPTTGGRLVIPATLTSIRSEFDFLLSANDQASGTSRFDVQIPEPATLALLALGGMGMLLRRRRK